MMRVIARRAPSQRSWDPPYGTKPFPMMEILSSWNTWTWKSFCRKMASPPALTMTTALTLPGCSRLPQRPPPSWTSAVGPLLPFTLASSPRTVCRAPSDQVNSQKFLPPDGEEGKRQGQGGGGINILIRGTSAPSRRGVLYFTHSSGWPTSLSVSITWKVSEMQILWTYPRNSDFFQV